MDFTGMRNLLIAHFNEMVQGATCLFEVGVDKNELWNLYLDSFPEGTNDISCERAWHNCSCCRRFIKAIGNAVVIKNNKMETIWGFKTDDFTYQPVLDALDAYIKSHVVTDVYVAKSAEYGKMENYVVTEDGSILTWTHFYLQLPTNFVDNTPRSEGEIKEDFRATKNVFKRSLDEFTMESLDTVLELISQNSLYKGEEWKDVLEKFKIYKDMYDEVPEEDKNNFAWEQSVKADSVIGRIRNHSMGFLLTDISKGMDLDTAVRRYERIVAPCNYKRPTAIYTKRMLEDAKKTITELGYLESLGRRYATLDDITVNDILFSNRDSAKRITGAGAIFADMEKKVATDPKKFFRVEEVPIEKFVSDILPTARELEVFLENKHCGNMVSLIAPQVRDSKTMFKWDNNFGWAYSGNMTDSMKERVKSAGGRVDGDLRFTIQWNEDGKDNCDLDAHCYEEPDKFEIFFNTAKKPRYSPSRGQLDVDIIHPGQTIAVENITWADRKTMKPGKYKFFVHQYNGSARRGFRAEIEFDGQIQSFDYSKSMIRDEKVDVAEVILNEDMTFSIKNLSPSTASTRDIWNLHTNQFVPVSVVCLSPNYWSGSNGTGNKHYFFMLKGCINSEEPNGFYNEFLKRELEQHRKVFEALGSKMKVEDAADQLSGLGFSSTKRADLIVKVKGTTERIIKIKF